jgi:hypothetical protein
MNRLIFQIVYTKDITAHPNNEWEHLLPFNCIELVLMCRSVNTFGEDIGTVLTFQPMKIILLYNLEL